MSFENQSSLNPAPAENSVGAALAPSAGAFAPRLAGPSGGGEVTSAPPGQGLAAAGKGPFNPAVNGMLTACYGHLADGITVARDEGSKNRGMGAEAHTIGRHISLGERVKEDPTDGQSMEIIGHEVAHALARGGSGQHILDKKGDPGEHIAYDAGRQFRQFAETGGKGPAPQLKPAFGGLAAVHRFEGGEHKDAVDNAAAEVKKNGGQVDENVSKLLDKDNKIKLKNGLYVSSGDITAMMGDFYGAFDEKTGKFDPAKSYEALQNASPEDMKPILARIEAERKKVDAIRTNTEDQSKPYSPVEKFEGTPNGELEDLTKYREKKVDKDGITTGYSMLDLAQKNSSHFSKKDESGTDNNMGAYNEFHRMALEQAKSGHMNEARILEASAMHYMTDRFAGGHQFDKDGVTKAFKDNHVGGSTAAGDLMGAAAVRTLHNEGNVEGVTVKNAKGDEPWLAMGDSHWVNNRDKNGIDPNAVNRLRASQAVVDSYAELQAVADGKKDPAKMKPQDYAVKKDIPEFDQKRQDDYEKRASQMDQRELAKGSAAEAAGILRPSIQRALITNFGKDGTTIVQNWDKAWSWTKNAYGAASDGISQGLDWISNTASDAGTGIKNGYNAAKGFVKETAGEAVSGIRSGVGKAVDFVGNTASDIGNGIKNGVSQASSWASETLGEAKDGITGGASSAWNWFTGAVGGAVHQVKEGGPSALLDYAKEKASEAGTGIKNGLGKAGDFASQKVSEAAHGLRTGAGEVYDFAADKVSQAGTGIRNGAHQAYDWAADKVGQASTGIRNGANQAYDWAAQKAGEAGTGIHNGVDWAKRTYGEAKQGIQEHGRETWDATKRVASSVSGSVKNWAHDKYDSYAAPVKEYVSEKYQGLRALPGELADEAGALAHRAGTTISNGAHAVENVAGRAAQSVKGTASSGWNWLKHQAGY